MSWLRFRAQTAPIMGFVGLNGSGKSASAVRTVIEQARRTGAPIASNIELRIPGVEVIEVGGPLDLIKLESTHVLWDDVSAVAPARETMSAPPEIVARFAHLRHVDCTLIWTCPVMSDVDVKLRQVTQSVVSMRALRSHDVEGQLWPRTSLAYANQYDTSPTVVTDINTETPKIGSGFVRMKDLPLDAYDTRADIELVADHAVCRECGLVKRREYCKGHHDASGITSIPEAKAWTAAQSSPPTGLPSPVQARLARPSTLALLGLDGADGSATLEGSR